MSADAPNAGEKAATPKAPPTPGERALACGCQVLAVAAMLFVCGGGFYLVFLKPAAPAQHASGPWAGLGAALTVLGIIYGLIRAAIEIAKMPRGAAPDVGTCKARLAGAGWVAGQETVILPGGVARYRVTAARGDRSVTAEGGDLPGTWREALRQAEATPQAVTEGD